MTPCVRSLFFTLLIAGFAAPAVAQELLSNPSFETGVEAPDDWTTFGAGTAEWVGPPARTGTRAIRLGSDTGQIVGSFQQVAALAGQRFIVRTWTQHDSGTAAVDLKIEFHDAGQQKLEETVRSLSAPLAWGQFFLVGEAPPGTAYVTATLVAGADGFALFDDVSLEEIPDTGEQAFDLTQLQQSFLGLGAQVWAHRSSPEWPDVEAIRDRALRDFEIRFIRIESYNEATSHSDLRALRQTTDALGIEWVYMLWSAPPSFQDRFGRLQDVTGFARWWSRHVSQLHARGVPVEYVEPMNEPDSGGQWSTGIEPDQFAQLVRSMRFNLDRRGFSAVGIVGPGTASTSWSDPGRYLSAMTSRDVGSLAAWSAHTWVDDSFGAYPEGGISQEGYWDNLGQHAFAREPTLPIFATEYATKQNVFHGVTYPVPDASSWDDSLVFPYYNATNTQPYAVRVFQNTLALLNAKQGVNAPFVWQLNDEPTEVEVKDKGWGLIDLWGRDKPVAGALRLLAASLPVGARVATPPVQAFVPLYAAVLTDGERVVLCVANGSDGPATTVVRLRGATAPLGVVSAVAFEPAQYGDPLRGEPDEGVLVAKTLSPTLDPSTGDTLVPVTLEADSVMTVVLEVAGSALPSGNTAAAPASGGLP